MIYRECIMENGYKKIRTKLCSGYELNKHDCWAYTVPSEKCVGCVALDWNEGLSSLEADCIVEQEASDRLVPMFPREVPIPLWVGRNDQLYTVDGSKKSYTITGLKPISSLNEVKGWTVTKDYCYRLVKDKVEFYAGILDNLIKLKIPTIEFCQQKPEYWLKVAELMHTPILITTMQKLGVKADKQKLYEDESYRYATAKEVAKQL